MAEDLEARLQRLRGEHAVKRLEAAYHRWLDLQAVEAHGQVPAQAAVDAAWRELCAAQASVPIAEQDAIWAAVRRARETPPVAVDLFGHPLPP